MTFKDPILKTQFWELVPSLRLILCDADVWAAKRGLDLCVTELMRSDEEQRKLFEAGAAQARTSVHQFGRGADVRAFPDPALNTLLAEYINRRYAYSTTRPNLKTMIYHEGNAWHGHLQVES